MVTFKLVTSILITWRKAYRLDGDITPIAEQLDKELGPVEPFGSKKGVKTKSLPKYRYMFTTERFNEIYELGEVC